nr:immunoglobulin heavy chain junction region [Mus musculus]
CTRALSYGYDRYAMDYW